MHVPLELDATVSKQQPEIIEGYRFTFKDGSKKGLGVDQAGNLYWDKKPIQLKQTVRLSNWVNSAAILAALATATQAVVAVLEYARG